MLRSAVKAFASRPAPTLVLWGAMVAFGALTYTTLIPREGFPPVDAPIAVANGVYLVDDTDRVDNEVALPLAEALTGRDRVERVESYARPSSVTVVVSFETGTSSAEGVAIIEAALASVDLPPEAAFTTEEVNASRFLNRYELLVGLYANPDTTPAELEEAAATLVPLLEVEADLAGAEVVELIDRGVDPATGQPVELVSSFNLLTDTNPDGLSFLPSIAVGVVAADGADSLTVRDATDRALAAADRALPEGFEAVVAIDFATPIRQQIGSLQSNVLTGIVAVSIVAFLLISWRASVVTALFIVTVLATTIGALYLAGTSLNTITLFGVILALGLLVDDAIVITESIVASRSRHLDDLSVIDRAISRVGSASIAGTLTTLLVFAPMLAISGILGDFIRFLPISVIVALTISLILSFVVIPVASRFLILPAPGGRGPLTGVEATMADFIAELPSAAGAKRVVRTTLAVGLSVAMTVVGLVVFAPRVGFNIFPPQNDSNEISVSLAFGPGTTLDEARAITGEVNEAAAEVLGSDLRQGYVFLGSSRRALGQLSLTPMGGRPAAPELVEQLQAVAESEQRARVSFTQISAGPPESTFPFQLQIYGEDLDVLVPAAQAFTAELDGAVIDRPNGTTFQVKETEVGFADIVARIDTDRVIEVRARFDADDVSTTTTQTQTFLEERFGPDRLASLGLAPDDVTYDFGMESDNQESFASLPLAFGLALVSMLVLLVIQFRSSTQWVLVFLAIPFSFFGVFGGLLLTGNVISFFVMLGLIGLIGIAVNNTILLVDYANQERRAGHDRGEAVRRAVRHRFRPLVATSLTTVAGLTPLALSDPFWEALGMTIIFGLLSSTFLVLVSFPFYYLGLEAVRDRVATPWRRRPDQETDPSPEARSGFEPEDELLTPVGGD